LRGQRGGELSGAIRAEIHEYHRIAVVHPYRLRARRHDRGGFDEFIGFVARVGGAQAG
jgi:hypothetical protein